MGGNADSGSVREDHTCINNVFVSFHKSKICFIAFKNSNLCRLQ